MPFDPSGNFTRVMNWQQDRDNGIRILADRHDAEDDNFAAAFNQVFLRGGIVPMTGDLNMGGYNINTIKAGSAAAPSLTWELDPDTGFYQPAPDSVAFSSNGVEKVRFEPGGITVKGHLRSSANSPILELYDAANAVRVGYVTHNTPVDNNMTISNALAGGIGFATNGASRMSITAAGKVGIGVDPAAQLHVVGPDGIYQSITAGASCGYGIYSDAAGVTVNVMNAGMAAYKPLNVAALTQLHTVADDASGAAFAIAADGKIGIGIAIGTLPIIGGRLNVLGNSTKTISVSIPTAGTTAVPFETAIAGACDVNTGNGMVGMWSYNSFQNSNFNGLLFKTFTPAGAQINAMAITGDGKVAIGHLSPIGDLHISRSVAQLVSIGVGNPLGYTQVGTDINGNAEMRCYNGHSITFGDDNLGGSKNNFVTIKPAAGFGYVGFGTISPTHDLEIRKPGGFADIFVLNDAGQAQLTLQADGNAGRCIVGTVSGAPLYFTTSNALRMVLGGDGTQFMPAADNATSLGHPSYRWTYVAAVSGTINTSDARLKDWLGALTASELEAAKTIAAGIGTYRWLDESLGSEKHVGVTAQAVIAAMEAQGLDAMEYGFVRYDEWEAIEEVPGPPAVEAYEGSEESGLAATGAIPAGLALPARPAGDLYSVNYGELSMFIAAAQEQRLAALEALL